MRIAVIGGGAAGFFGAITAKSCNPAASVRILESGSKVLSKVRISGGGRCNVTHACFDPEELSRFYPRGGKELRQAFSRFMTGDTIAWFESHGVPLKMEDDGRMFPVSDDSASIVDCLTRVAQDAGVEVLLNRPVSSLEQSEAGWKTVFRDGSAETYDKILIATGGQPNKSGFSWLERLGHTIEPPVPSLFTFNLPKQPVVSLMGVSVNPVTVTLPEERLSVTGPLLITHWGFSGPAVLKLSSLAARSLAGRDYRFTVSVNWTNDYSRAAVLELINETRVEHPASRVSTTSLVGLPKRLWEFLLERSAVRSGINWSDLRREEYERLAAALTDDRYPVSGKTTFKEEFVTCGGVSLKEVDFKTMESKVCPGLYFAGEVLDMDGLTGGFNFQAAWTTGYLAGSAAAGR